MLLWKRLVKILALAGALSLTACVGTDLNQPANQLNQGLSQSAVRIKQEGGQLKVVVLTDNAFTGKSVARLSPQMIQVLAQITQTLHNYPDLKVKVAAYTDNRHSSKTNQLISLRRAMVIADYFRNHGVASNRISVIGMGESDPIADNATSQGRAQNRRIEINLS